jgi:hypothetical protein
MDLEINIKNEYGHARRYIVDPRLEAAYTRLTGRMTIRDADLDALLALGVRVVEQTEGEK